MTALRIPLPDIPARAVCNLEDPISVDWALTAAMPIGPVVCDVDGTVVAGARAVLADSNLGMAMIIDGTAISAGMVTSHLHIEFARAISARATSLSCTASMRSATSTFGLVEATFDDGTGDVLANATLGGIYVTRPTNCRQPARSMPRSPDLYPSKLADVDVLLETDTVASSEHETTVEFGANPWVSTFSAMYTAGWGR